MSDRSKTYSPLLLLLIAVGGFLLANQIYPGRPVQAETQRDVYEELKIFAEVLGKVEDMYVEEPKMDQLMEGAIQGMLSTLDPHSAYLPPEMYKELTIDTEGSFGGLGIEITMAGGILRVISPIDGTPAANAGIKPGDRILKIDGKETKSLSIMEAVNLMRGKQGTEVTLNIWRNSFDEPKDFKLTRAVINIQSVRTAHLIEEGYGYVRITQFQKDTTEQLMDALEDLTRQSPNKKLDGLVLDLRNNPGGLLNEAITVADIFIDKGLLVYTQGRTEGTKEEFLAKRKGFEDVPLVVLVNEGSASASEIVAGAIQDHKRGILLGRQTFGKGSVQHVVPIDDPTGGSNKTAAIKLTIARYYTPSGRSIQEKGITPDIEVDEEEWVRNKELAKGPEPMREKDLKGHLPAEEEPGAADKTEEKMMKDEIDAEIEKTQAEKDADDYVLQRGLEILKGWMILSRKAAVAE